MSQRWIPTGEQSELQTPIEATELTKELQATVAHQQKQIEALTAGLQKLSAQFEATKPAPQVVNNP